MASQIDEEFQQQISESGPNSRKVADTNIDNDDDRGIKRTGATYLLNSGTLWTASAHIITAIIGSGVLSLAWGMAQLGWITGIGTLLIFACITVYTSSLLADCYRSPDPVSGKRNRTYMEAVRAILGGRMYKACGLVQYTCITGLSVGYTITASTSMVALQKSNCFHRKGQRSACKYSCNLYMIAMGIIEIILSQIPSLHKMSWLSIIAAIMSFGYATIGVGLSLAKLIAGQGARTTLTGVEVGIDVIAADKVWTMFRALGDMVFAFTYAGILIEIQDTLKSPPLENKVMKKANLIAILTSTAFYMMCGCLGYAALGNHAPGNMLTDFGFYEPFWLIDLANIFIVVHLLGAYQVLSQPVLNAFESWASMRWPKSKFVNNEYPIKIGKKNLNFRVNMLRLTWRTVYVVMVTVIAMALPFFNYILALIGAIGYWPLTIYFPVEMYIAQKKIERQTIRWFSLQLLNLVCLLVAIAAGCGAIQGLNHALRTYSPFKF